MIYDIYNIPLDLASKFWIIYPFTRKIYMADAPDNLKNLPSKIIDQVYNERKIKYNTGMQTDALTVKIAKELSPYKEIGCHGAFYQTLCIYNLYG